MNHNMNKSSNRSFGIIFFIVFILIGIWPLLNYESYRSWAIITAFIFLILGLINSKLLTPLNILWFKFGILVIGNCVLDKNKQDPDLKKDYTNEFELD